MGTVLAYQSSNIQMTKPLFHITVVDDNPVYLMMIRKYLCSLGFEHIDCIQDSTTGIINNCRVPHLIFLDYCMPEADGLQVLKQIKRLYPEVPVVFLSGQTDMEVAMMAMKCGAYDYIVKNSNEFKRIEEVIYKVFDEAARGTINGFSTTNHWYGKPSDKLEAEDTLIFQQ